MPIISASDLTKYGTVPVTVTEDVATTAIAQAQAMLEAFCGYLFDSGSYSTYRDSVYHEKELILESVNITSSTVSVFYDTDFSYDSTTELDDDSYSTDTVDGIIYLKYGYAPHARAFKITYTGGYTSDTAPEGLKGVVAALASHIYMQISSGNIAVIRETIGSTTPLLQEGLPKNIQSMALPYIRGVL